jgi:hypothetical protein
MKEIPLTQGKVALVDDEDFEAVSAVKWYAQQSRVWYAAHKRDRLVYMHRMILTAPPGMQVDHINGNGLDNRRSNLRLCSNSQNHANLRKRPETSSRFKGVYWNKARRKWHAQIKVNQCTFYLGLFESEEAAGAAYDRAAAEHFGVFSRLNDIERSTGTPSARAPGAESVSVQMG